MEETSLHMSISVGQYLLMLPSARWRMMCQEMTKRITQNIYRTEEKTHTLDSRFIKTADLVAALARSSCAWSTEREKNVINSRMELKTIH